MTNPIITRTVTVPAGNDGVRVDIPGRYVRIRSCTAVDVLMAFDAGTPERVYAEDCYAGPPGGFDSLRFVDDIGAGSTVVVQILAEPVLPGSTVTLAGLLAVLTTIDADTGAMVVDLAALELLVTATNALLTTIDADTGAMVVDLAALEVLVTATNALLTTIDADTGNLPAILDRLALRNTPTTINATPAQTGVGSTQIVVGGANLRTVCLQAPVADGILAGNIGSVYIGFAAGVTAANCAMVLAPGDVMREELSCDIYASSENGTDTLKGYRLETA